MKGVSGTIQLKSMIRLVIPVLVVSLTGFFFCGRVESDRDRILGLIDSLESMAEKKYTASILDCLSDDFRDMEDRSKPEIEKLLNSYFDRYTGIVVNILSSRFVSLKPPQAEVETDVSLSSGAAKMFRNLVAYSGQTYRFAIELEKQGEQWKIVHASWRYVSLQELFPESMKILKKLFPKL